MRTFIGRKILNNNGTVTTELNNNGAVPLDELLDSEICLKMTLNCSIITFITV